MSGGGTNTVESQSAPPQQFLDAYQNVTNQATGVAGTPLQTYSGNTVAPLSPDTNTGISEVQDAQGLAAPYINSAASYINSSTAPLAPSYQPYANQAQGLYQGAAQQLQPTQFSPSAVQQYESPYTQQVLQTTQAAENNQDAQQQQQVEGNAVSQGAMGGDREAVAQGITAGQQAIANNQTNAGIENTGYNNALGEFNQEQQTGLTAQQQSQQLALGAGQGISGIGSTMLGANEANSWLNSQAGFGMSNLGNQALTTSLTGANAELGVGGLEQSQAQAELNVPYQNYLAEEAYPFQTTGWLAGIDEGLGGASGGSSSTSSPAASTASQVAGLGVTGLGAYGLLNSTGAFGASGWLTGASAGADLSIDGALAMGIAHGGAIPHRDGGGAIPPDLSIGHIPSAPMAPGHSTIPPVPHALTAPTLNGTLQGGLSALKGSGILKPNQGNQQSDARGGGIVVPLPARGASHGRGIVANDDWIAEPERARASGGSMPVSVTLSPGSYAGSQGIPTLNTAALSSAGITGGGTSSAPAAAGALGQSASATNSPVASYLGSVLAGASFAPPNIYTPPPPQASASTSASASPAPASTIPGDPTNGAFWDTALTPPQWRGGAVKRRADGGDTGDGDMPIPPIPPGQEPAQTTDGPPAPAMAGIVPEESPSRDAGIGSSGANPWKAILATGLGIMGGTSPQAMVNIGRGGLQGLEFGQKDQQEHQADAFRQRQLAQQGNYQNKEIDLRGREISSNERLRQAALDQTASLERAKMAQTSAYQSGELGLRREALNQNRYVWQPGQGKDENGNDVSGSYRFASKGDEPPQFFPGVVQQQKGQSSSAQLTPDAIDSMANRALKGDYSWTTGLSRNQTAMAAINNRLVELKRQSGATDDDIATAGQKFKATTKAVSAFDTGPQGNSVRSLNVGVQHLDTLSQLTDALSNGDTQALNRVQNWWQTQTGAAAPTNFAAARDLVADEIVKAAMGAGVSGALADREAVQKNLAQYSSPNQLAGAINNYKALLAGQMHGLKKQYESSTGLSDFDSKLFPETKAALDQASNAHAAAAGFAASTQPTSWKYSATGKGGFKAFSNDGNAWFNRDGSPIGNTAP